MKWLKTFLVWLAVFVPYTLLWGLLATRMELPLILNFMAGLVGGWLATEVAVSTVKPFGE